MAINRGHVRWTTAIQQCTSVVGGTSCLVCAGECSNAQCYSVCKLLVVVNASVDILANVYRRVRHALQNLSKSAFIIYGALATVIKEEGVQFVIWMSESFG